MGVLVSAAVLAAALVSPSSAQVTEPQPAETASAYFDVVDFLAEHRVELPAGVAAQFNDLIEEDQYQRLLSLGIDSSILQSNVDERPMPVVAELLRVLDPDAPRPEVASDVAYARSMVDAAVGVVIADLQEEYSARLGFARWDSTADGGRVFVIPVVGASPTEVEQIEAVVLPDETPIRVESTDISYQDLRELKDAVYASIKTATGNQLGDWSIGIDGEAQKVIVRVDLSLEHNTEVLAKIDGSTATIADGHTANIRTGGLATGNDATVTFDEGQPGSKETGDLLAGLTAIVRGVADSFVATMIPASNRKGVELVSIAHAKIQPPDTDYRESEHIRGGEWIEPDSGGACTTNFLWKKGSDYQMGTAGHCSTTTGTSKGHRAYRSFDHRTLAGDDNGDIGTVTLNGWTNGSYSDYALMTLPAAATTTNRVMTTGRNWRTVTAVSALSNLSRADQPFCLVGWGLKKTHGLDKSCGTITVRDIHQIHRLSTGDNLTLYGLYCTTAKRAGGDSGGPHYIEVGDDAYAVGIHHGPNTAGDACFTTVQAAKARHGYSIVLN